MSAAGPTQSGDKMAADRTARWPWAGDWRLRFSLVVLVALAPRLVYLFEMRSWPFFHYPILDSRTQWKWAGILVQSHWIGNIEVLAKAPLYAYYLALNQWALRDNAASLFSAYLVQLVLGSINCGLTYLIGRRVFGERVAVVAGLLLALYSPGIFRDGQLLDTTLATLLAAWFLLVLMRAFDEPAGRVWLKAGLVLGLLGLTRPNLLLLGVMAVVLMLVWLRKPGRAGAGLLPSDGEGAEREVLPCPATGQAGGLPYRPVALLLIGVVLTILPITGRNYLVTGRLVPISATGGINFHTGNNPESDGYSPIPSGIAWERTWYEAMGAGKLNTIAQDTYWQRKALNFWREQPGAALALLLKKIYLYWSAYEIPNNVSYDWGRQHSSMLRAVPLTFAAIGPLGLLGLVIGGWRSRRALILGLSVLTQMLAVVAFFVAGRYRMPALPALCVLGAFAVIELARWVSARKIGWLALGLGTLAVFALLVNSDWYGVRRSRGANRDRYYLGQSYVLAGRSDRARDAFREAIRQDPSDADAFALLGQTETYTGEPEAARDHLLRSLELAPDYTMAALRLAELCLREEWPLDEPRQLLYEAVQRQPRSVDGLAMLVRLDIRLGDHERARSELVAAVKLVSQRSVGDTRTAAAVQAVMQAAQEAQQAGIALPPELLAR